MAVSYCGGCGEPSREDERFCIGCGHSLRRQTGASVVPGALNSARREHEILLQHALTLLARNEAGTALAVLEPLCAERPLWAVARAYLGIALLRLARVADARAELEEAVRRAPESFICHAKYGEFLARLGFYDQAIVEIDAALAVTPPDVDSRYAAMELRQFAKDKSKGLFYRKAAYPSFSRLMPRRRPHQSTVASERGI